MSSTALGLAPRRRAVLGGGAPPDRLMLWPLDHGRYGLDATFDGAWGCEDAEDVAHQLGERALPHVLRQEQGGAWTVRVGPVSSLQVAELLAALSAP